MVWIVCFHTKLNTEVIHVSNIGSLQSWMGDCLGTTGAAGFLFFQYDLHSYI